MIRNKLTSKILHSALIGIVAFSGNAHGRGKPSLDPKPDTDLIREIRKGMEDTECVEQMGKALETFRTQLKDLKDKIKTPPSAENEKAKGKFDEEIKAGEKALKKSRYAYLEKMQTCGPCRTHAVEDWPRETFGHWYFSDGSCVMDEEKPEKGSTEEIETYNKTVKEAYDRMVASLKNPGLFTKFPHILHAKFLNEKKDAFIPNTETLGKSFHAFIAVRVPLLMVDAIKSLISYHYYILNNVTEPLDRKEGEREFILSFKNAEKPPAELQKQFLAGMKEYTSPGNRKFSVSPLSLSEISAQWVVSESTTSWRYSTFAHFGQKIDAVKKDGQTVLLEALLEMRRRARNEKEEGGIP